MKKLFSIMMLLLLSFTLFGCNPLDSNPGMEGYVVKKDNGRILVVDPSPKAIGETKEYYNAIWFSNAGSADIGQKVKVWFNAVDDSYPGQAAAQKVSVVQSDHPKGSDMSEAEAIRNVLKTHSTSEITIIKKVWYDMNTDSWNVLIKQGKDEFNVQVKDNDETVYKEVVLPEDIPDFVQESDFETIDWEQKAAAFGDRGIIGNENKSGVIGADMPSLNGQKWMWHLWGVDDADLTIVGFHKETQTVHQILMGGWTIRAHSPINGADAVAPSAVKFTEPGEWAVLLYTDDKLFDILVYEIND